jgi:hypothetical protein
VLNELSTGTTLPFTFDLPRHKSTSVTVSCTLGRGGVLKVKNLDTEPCWLPNDSFTHLLAEPSNEQPDASTAEMRVTSVAGGRSAKAAFRRPPPSGVLWLDSAQEYPCWESYTGLPVLPDHVTELS